MKKSIKRKYKKKKYTNRRSYKKKSYNRRSYSKRKKTKRKYKKNKTKRKLYRKTGGYLFTTNQLIAAGSALTTAGVLAYKNRHKIRNFRSKVSNYES